MRVAKKVKRTHQMRITREKIETHGRMPIGMTGATVRQLEAAQLHAWP